MPKNILSEKLLNSDAEYDFLENRDAAAAAIDADIVFPKDDELQIDIDSEEAHDRFKAAFSRLREVIPVELVTDRPSKSGMPHRHITIKMDNYGQPPFSPLEKIALQFMLGSDYIRESISVIRCLRNIENPTCFFEVKTDRKFKPK